MDVYEIRRKIDHRTVSADVGDCIKTASYCDALTSESFSHDTSFFVTAPYCETF